MRSSASLARSTAIVTFVYCAFSTPVDALPIVLAEAGQASIYITWVVSGVRRPERLTARPGEQRYILAVPPCLVAAPWPATGPYTKPGSAPGETRTSRP